jgi:hypothetical protein
MSQSQQILRLPVVQALFLQQQQQQQLVPICFSRLLPTVQILFQKGYYLQEVAALLELY